MGPPSLLVWFGKGQATRQPQQHVVMEGAALLELGHPDVAQAMATAAHPVADVAQELADVALVPAPDLAVGQGEHRWLESLVAELELVHAAGREDGPSHAAKTGQEGVDLNEIGGRSTCMRSDKPRAAAAARCADRRRIRASAPPR